MQQKNIQRESIIDIARALALFLVIIGHLIYAYRPPFRWIFAFHMPAFFFLSGYTHRDQSPIGYLKKRSSSLMVPYAVFLALGALVTLSIGERPPLRTVLVQSFINMQPEVLHVGQVWFLPALLLTGLLFCLIREIERRSPVWVRAAIYAAIFAAAALISKYIGMPRSVILPFKTGTAIIAVMFYAAGFFTKQRGLTAYLQNRMICAAIVPVMAVVVYVFGVKFNASTINLCDSRMGNPICYMIAAFAGILMLLAAASVVRESKILQFYGRNTLYMFATHSFFIMLMTWVLTKLTGREIAAYSMPYAEAIAIAIAIIILLAPLGALHEWQKKKKREKVKEEKK